MQALWHLAHSPHHILSQMQLNALFANALFSCIHKQEQSSNIQVRLQLHQRASKIDIRLCVCRPLALGIATGLSVLESSALQFQKVCATQGAEKEQTLAWTSDMRIPHALLVQGD